MQLTLTFRHMSPTDALKKYVEKKVLRLDKYCEKEGRIHAILETNRPDMRCELILHISGAQIPVEESKDDLYAAIDLAIDKAERALVRRKEKLKKHSSH